MSIIDSLKIKEAIAHHVAPSELWGDPVFDESLDMWVAVVAITSAGPLVRMGFKMKFSMREVLTPPQT